MTHYTKPPFLFPPAQYPDKYPGPYCLMPLIIYGFPDNKLPLALLRAGAAQLLAKRTSPTSKSECFKLIKPHTDLPEPSLSCLMILINFYLWKLNLALRQELQDKL